MISVTKIFTFEAAHRLPEHTGLCKNLHGHTYKLEVTLTRVGIDLDTSTCMVLDFGDVKAAFEPLIKKMDHKYLNDIPGLEMPTAENMLKYIVAEASRELSIVRLIKVRLWETPTSYATWTC